MAMDLRYTSDVMMLYSDQGKNKPPPGRVESSTSVSSLLPPDSEDLDTELDEFFSHEPPPAALDEDNNDDNEDADDEGEEDKVIDLDELKNDKLTDDDKEELMDELSDVGVPESDDDDEDMFAMLDFDVLLDDKFKNDNDDGNGKDDNDDVDDDLIVDKLSDFEVSDYGEEEEEGGVTTPPVDSTATAVEGVVITPDQQGHPTVVTNMSTVDLKCLPLPSPPVFALVHTPNIHINGNSNISIVEEAAPKDYFSTLPKKQRQEESDEQQQEQQPTSKRARPVPSPEDELVKSMSNWKPFLNQLQDFMQDEPDVPFDYADIWVPSSGGSNRKQKQAEDDGGDKNSSNCQLVHVAHSFKDDEDNLFTLYHLNAFGQYSTQFTFAPGTGLPGRAFASHQPIWDNHLQCPTTATEFPRAQGARQHGIQTALGIPLVLDERYSRCLVNTRGSSSGYCNDSGTSHPRTVVLALYSTRSDVTKTDRLIQKCCSTFQKTCRPLAPEEVVASLIDKSNNDTMGVNSDDDEALEMEIAELLGAHMPTSANDDRWVHLSEFVSLRLLLLRSPSQRSAEETRAVRVVKDNYRKITVNRKMEEHHGRQYDKVVATMLATQWMFLKQNNMYGTSSTRSLAARLPQLMPPSPPREPANSAPCLPSQQKTSDPSKKKTAPTSVFRQSSTPPFELTPMAPPPSSHAVAPADAVRQQQSSPPLPVVQPLPLPTVAKLSSMSSPLREPKSPIMSDTTPPPSPPPLPPLQLAHIDWRSMKL